ncbi:MAG: hypothetical protein J6I31_01930 [Prevotella sp.]|nr:hypothetical protein [Prevotella sp.]
MQNYKKYPYVVLFLTFFFTQWFEEGDFFEEGEYLKPSKTRLNPKKEIKGDSEKRNKVGNGKKEKQKYSPSSFLVKNFLEKNFLEKNFLEKLIVRIVFFMSRGNRGNGRNFPYFLYFCGTSSRTSGCCSF